MSSNPSHPSLSHILRLQESALVSRVESVRATAKSELIGAEFETAIQETLASLVPSTMRVVSGFVVRPDGSLSSHFDGLFVDTRYPLLATTAGSALVPLHTLLGGFELKTVLNKKKLKEALSKADEFFELGDLLCGVLTVARRGQLVSAGASPNEALKAALEEHANRPTRPWFRVLALRTDDLSQISIAMRLWKIKSKAHIMVLRPQREHQSPNLPGGSQIEWKCERERQAVIITAEGNDDRDNDELPKKMPVQWIGENGPAQHFFIDDDGANHLDLFIRGTSRGYGYFLFEMIQSTLSVAGERAFEGSQIEAQIGTYLNLLVERRVGIIHIESDPDLQTRVKEELHRTLPGVSLESISTLDALKKLYTRYNTFDISLIIAGWNLNFVKSEELIQNIRDLDEDIPVIIVTGRPKHFEHYAKRAGADVVVGSAFSDLQLLTTEVRRILRRESGQFFD